jgi:hypothetical protein
MSGQFAPRLPQYRQSGKTALGDGKARPASSGIGIRRGTARIRTDRTKSIFQPELNETKPLPDR